MDLRPRTLIRLDRLRSRIEFRIPAALKSSIGAEAERLFSTPAGKLDFMRRVDRFQQSVYERLLRAYRDEPFSRLFTLKLANLAVAKFHYLNRHAVLASSPFQLTIDPANACQLACPGCVHTSNATYAAKFDWPALMLPLDAYTRFIDRFGPFAFCAYLYNYGEPLLHKRFPDFVRLAGRYLLFTMTSTNLSMPLSDPDAIVASGLDRMILSIDGTTQGVYERYRRKGDLGLVFENVRKLAAAKKKLGSTTPYLVWQFLTFEHNAHQASDALRMARRVGVNEILIQTPFDVDIDDPQIRAATAPENGRYTLDPWEGNRWSTDRRRRVGEMAAPIETLFRQSWEERWMSIADGDEDSRPGAAVCDWLYHNTTIDGAARLMPCCMAPDKEVKHLVFEKITEDSGGRDLVNSPMARRARSSFRERGTYVAGEADPYCARCSETPQPYGLANVAGDIRALDERRALPRSLQWALTWWG